MLDPELLDLLRCPNCRGETEYRESEEVIACTGSCGNRYAVVKGIPYMLVDEAIEQ